MGPKHASPQDTLKVGSMNVLRSCSYPEVGGVGSKQVSITVQWISSAILEIRNV